ncbi:DNA ligase D domain protein [Burkholderia pseudomallei]|nr:DNA ligase D domain protein [Burkholderia pseudomallei]
MNTLTNIRMNIPMHAPNVAPADARGAKHVTAARATRRRLPVIRSAAMRDRPRARARGTGRRASAPPRGRRLRLHRRVRLRLRFRRQGARAGAVVPPRAIEPAMRTKARTKTRTITRRASAPARRRWRACASRIPAA